MPGMLHIDGVAHSNRLMQDFSPETYFPSALLKTYDEVAKRNHQRSVI